MIKIKNNIILKAAFFLIFIALFSLFIVIPRAKVFIKNYRNLSENKKQLAYLEAKKENLLKLSKEKEQIENALTKSGNIIPDTVDTSNFLSQIDATFQLAGVNAKSVSMSEPKKESQQAQEETTTSQTKTQTTEQSKQQGESKSKFKTYSFSISFTSDYPNLVNFLKLSENLGRFTNINSVDISLTQDNQMETKIKGDIFYKK